MLGIADNSKVDIEATPSSNPRPPSASLVVVLANRIVPDPIQPVVADDDLFGHVLLAGVYRNKEIEIEGFRGRIDYIGYVERWQRPHTLVNRGGWPS
jgi:hypothetical protein